jgi:A/G-specific adenine glycosylase
MPAPSHDALPSTDRTPADLLPGGSAEARVTALAASAGPLSDAALTEFRTLVLGYYDAFGRDLPWRRTTDPYGVVVSEVMLQQTQVQRVEGRWERFIERFPSFEALAAAPLAAVLDEWQGLGYNRRAGNLKRLAQAVVSDHSGVLPSDPATLRTLPGLGPATAASVSVFAFDTPVAFVETNIRAVYLHVFFADRDGVTDREIEPVAVAALPASGSRVWHWALMDYGAQLKRTVPNPSRRSAHHARQSAFEGSRRQLRGRVLRELLAADSRMSTAALAAALDGDARLDEVLSMLRTEGMLVGDETGWTIAG